MDAYILIQTEVGRGAAVARDVAAVQGVSFADVIAGPYDVIVRARTRSIDELGRLVVAKLQAIEGVTRTLTCPIIHV